MGGLKVKVSLDDLLFVYDKIIRRNFKNKSKLYYFEKNKMVILNDLVDSINNNKYYLDKYNVFYITRPKVRIIMSLSIRDKIVNHFITLKYLIPSLDKYLINNNVATRKNMGTDYGIKLVKGYLERFKKYDNFYCLKLDIKKYFYNIDHNILKEKLKDKLDSNIYNLICMILDSTNSDYINKKIYDIRNKLNSDDIPLYKYDKGLCIGNMSSQFLAIFYLYELDYYIVHTLRLPCYVRYMDDFIMFHNDKDYLKKCMKIIEDKLKNEYKLELNDKSRIYDVKDGFDFLGYNFKVINKKTIIWYSKKSLKNIKNNIKHSKKNITSFNGYMNYSNIYKFVKDEYIKEYLDNTFILD